ncbi:hypothetical protein EVAR_50323_1 [Eumeta japonica]|uniref:Uncharacterized protein n=1 Tax=Eumeta variegata TaxID=151549 RepID=A0A4C1XRH1_EUMVA|nr:hypothetical protein EVAR_50323_1 [Eumeta japonica]
MHRAQGKSRHFEVVLLRHKIYTTRQLKDQIIRYFSEDGASHTRRGRADILRSFRCVTKFHHHSIPEGSNNSLLLVRTVEHRTRRRGKSRYFEVVSRVTKFTPLDT